MEISAYLSIYVYGSPSNIMSTCGWGGRLLSICEIADLRIPSPSHYLLVTLARVRVSVLHNDASVHDGMV